MPHEPTVQPLPYTRRSWFFRILLTIFVCLVPGFIFYATGYRLSLTDTNNIISVGGIFVTAETEDTAIFLNEEVVENYRLFQRAAYIQNLPAGIHRLHVQGEGLHTWVKELPVYPHIVTEAHAFNMPSVPQVRLIMPYQTVGGVQFIPAATGTTPMGDSVEYRSLWFASTTVATTTLQVNEEFAYVTELFATSSTSTTPTLRSRIREQIEATFMFSSDAPTSTLAVGVIATTTRIQNERRLYETENGLFVNWEGSSNDYPYYFCINLNTEIASSSPFTAYVENNVANVIDSTELLTSRGDFACRSTIAIDTQNKEVLLFDFFPDNPNLVLLHLSDGLYVVEVDDRSWQNAQLLYAGTDFTVALANQQIYIEDGDYYFELFTTLEN